MQIRKAINICTDTSIWPDLWKTKPRQIWYCYPSKDMISSEIDTKWVPEFLPRGDFKNSQKYGWELKRSHGSYSHIAFNSGVSLYFKSYNMSKTDLQGSSVHWIFLDEEAPIEMIPEFNARLIATDGYMSMVFTPTLGQDEWRRTMEVRGEAELYKDAWKKCVSLYDCLFYADGTPSGWTEERIQRVIASCATDAEVQRRVFGRFIKSEGLLYPMFNTINNIKPFHPLNLSSGHVYVGIDPGSGGATKTSHPATICFVWVNSKFSEARIFKGWKSPHGVSIEPRDIMEKYIELKGSMVVTGEFYDFHDLDFKVVATRLGFAFQGANKNRDFGHQLINLLFKSGRLIIYDTDELRPLITELCSVGINEPKTSCKDDYIDAMRYALTSVPWDMEEITQLKNSFDAQTPQENKTIDMRTNPPQDLINTSELEQEFEFWNSHYDGGSD